MLLLLGIQATGIGTVNEIDLKGDATGRLDNQRGFNWYVFHRGALLELIEAEDWNLVKEMLRLDNKLTPVHFEWSSWSDGIHFHETTSWEGGFRVTLSNGHSQFLLNRDDVMNLAPPDITPTIASFV